MRKVNPRVIQYGEMIVKMYASFLISNMYASCNSYFGTKSITKIRNDDEHTISVENTYMGKNHRNKSNTI